MRTQKKEYLHIRIEGDVKDALLKYCEENITTPSLIIRDYIKKIINEKKMDIK